MSIVTISWEFPSLRENTRFPYILRPSLIGSRGCISVKNLFAHFRRGNQSSRNASLIIPFTKWHDAADPHSFIVSCEDVTVGVFTDIGKPCDQVIAHFRKCDAAFLETNYDEERLMNGKYPYYLKNRIRGEKGHLSNHQALELFQSHRPAFMSHLLLSHLSKENNSPEIAAAVFANHAGNTKITIASRDRATEIFRIIHEKQTAMPAGPVLHQPRQTQLTLFRSGDGSLVHSKAFKLNCARPPGSFLSIIFQTINLLPCSIPFLFYFHVISTQCSCWSL